MQLDGKVAIITGAGSGFGAATATLFAREGARVVAADLNLDTARETVSTIETEGGTAIAVEVDVANSDQVQSLVNTAASTYGGIDILFNNAGVYASGKVTELSEEDWRKTVDVNLTGVFLASKYAMPYLVESAGCVLNTGSAGGLIGFPAAVAYGATKGGVVSMTRAMAVDHAADGVRVNAVCPGTGRTGMTSELLDDPEAREAFLAPVPMREEIMPIDIAQAALYLCSDAARMVTGVALPVDGGWTMS